jgi:iron complex transport system permease protein
VTTAPPRESPVVAPRRRPAAARLLWFLAALVVLAALCVASVAFGVRDIAPADLISGLGGATDTVSQAAVVARLPRTALAVVVGAALALAGATMQAVTRNPLADPGILGILGGASLAVVVGIAFFGLAAPLPTMGVAVAGAAGAALFVSAVGSLGRGGPTPLKIALAGAACSAAFLSLTTAVLLPRVDVMETFRFWQIGGVGGATWDRFAIALPPLAIGAIICLLCARAMNSLALGDDLAAGLGVHVLRTRLVASAGAVVLCGVATSIAGPIAFVGLIIPHLCRLLVGSDHRWLLPFTLVTGAGLLVAADVVGRLVARPAELEVGIVTAFIGAPVFIWIVRRQRMQSL